MKKPMLKEADAEKLGDKLDVIADHSSIRERAAADAERATVDLKMCNIWQTISAKNLTALFPV